MRVLVDGICTWDGAKTGVGYYTSGLLTGLASLTAADAVHLYPPAWLGCTLAGWKRCRRWLPHGRGRLDEPPKGPATKGPPSLKHRLLQRHFEHFCQRGGYDLYHEPNHIPFVSDVPTLATIHDLSVLLHPEWHPAERVRDYERRFERGLARCSHLLTVSEFTRRQVITVLGWPADRVTRTYNGVRASMRPLPPEMVQGVLHRLNLPSRYLLHVGTIEPRKNLLMLLNAYRSLPSQLRASCPLVLVGGWGWNHEEIGRFLQTESRHLPVFHVGYLPERDLPAIYNGARALVLPSHYEGFGLPAVEMLACGGAVLASTAEALVELVSGQAHLVDPADEAGWRQAMQRIITDDEWRSSLRAGATRRASHFTWEACAAQTLRVYSRLSGETPTIVARAG